MPKAETHNSTSAPAAAIDCRCRTDLRVRSSLVDGLGSLSYRGATLRKCLRPARQRRRTSTRPARHDTRATEISAATPRPPARKLRRRPIRPRQVPVRPAREPVFPAQCLVQIPACGGSRQQEEAQPAGLSPNSVIHSGSAQASSAAQRAAERAAVRLRRRPRRFVVPARGYRRGSNRRGADCQSAG